jgi:acetoin utilization protein AcuB
MQGAAADLSSAPCSSRAQAPVLATEAMVARKPAVIDGGRPGGSLRPADDTAPARTGWARSLACGNAALVPRTDVRPRAPLPHASRWRRHGVVEAVRGSGSPTSHRRGKVVCRRAGIEVADTLDACLGAERMKHPHVLGAREGAMIVQDIMQRQVVVGPETTLGEIARLLRSRGIRHLPVVDQGTVIGIISDRDLKGALASAVTTGGDVPLASLLDRLTAADVMTRAVVTIAPMFPIEEAARIMVTGKISALPVTENGRLVGIVTDTDVLHLFVRAMGVTEPSSRIDVTLGEDPHALARVVHAVEGAGGVISSIMTLKSPATD